MGPQRALPSANRASKHESPVVRAPKRRSHAGPDGGAGAPTACSMRSQSSGSGRRRSPARPFPNAHSPSEWASGPVHCAPGLLSRPRRRRSSRPSPVAPRRSQRAAPTGSGRFGTRGPGAAAAAAAADRGPSLLGGGARAFLPKSGRLEPKPRSKGGEERLSG